MIDVNSLIEGKSADEIVAMAKGKGLDLTPGEVAAYVKEEGVELTDEQLAMIDGGVWGLAPSC